jgi:hypothetical protein
VRVSSRLWPHIAQGFVGRLLVSLAVAGTSYVRRSRILERPYLAINSASLALLPESRSRPETDSDDRLLRGPLTRESTIQSGWNQELLHTATLRATTIIGQIESAGQIEPLVSTDTTAKADAGYPAGAFSPCAWASRSHRYFAHFSIASRFWGEYAKRS